MNGDGDEVWIKVWEIRFVSFCRFVNATKGFLEEKLNMKTQNIFV